MIWQELTDSGLSVFWSDNSLRKELGESWFDKIEESLERSQHLVLLVTKKSLKSKWVLREYKAFLNSCYEENKRRLIPLLNHDITIAELPLFMREFQTFKLDDPGSVKILGNLIREYGFRSVKMDPLKSVPGGQKTNEINITNAGSKSYEGELITGTNAKKQISGDLQYGNFTDPRDNRTYKTIRFNNTTWFAENLNFESKNSRVYGNAMELSFVYGRLYTWDDALSSCPEGWRIPDFYDWDEIISYFGGYGVAGEQLLFPGSGFPKSTGPDENSKAGFHALYGGMSAYKISTGLKRKGYFWSSDEYDKDNAWRYAIHSNDEKINKEYREKFCFFSVRCVKK